ncbi:AfsR/SARP family transcriptional regulator [Asanoa siamensis]|uniref:XRE family transcriptional regulator n=1 Tax=Asanoa siamensis TaxID=926357 RepID=A0ABQ4D4F6_9ACTN|nr:AfsR/SARP family transcriptional regulator [Asanoa siamensis]GIF78414.1 XRE family transcriptional regulator [Asanoa siamensis]
MEFGVLGALRLVDGASVVPAPNGMPGRILAMLLARRGEPMSIDAIIEQLWPGEPPRTARKTTQVYIHHLRGRLDHPDRVSFRNGGYLLALAPEELDAARFERLVASAADAPVEVAADLLDEALALWRGPAFEDVAGLAAATEEAARLQDLRLAAVEQSVRAGLALGRHHQLVPRLRAAVVEWPFNESIHASLMTALHSSGRTREALEVYAALRATLATELGVEPGEEVRSLHRRVLRGERLSAPADPRPVGNFLPNDLRDFTGRDVELRQLSETLGEQSTVTVIATIGGLGGLGKTALAVHWAHRVTHHFPDGQLYVNLRGFGHAPPVDTATALRHLLSCLGVPRAELPSDVDDAAARYRAAVAGKRMLVLLDDARDIEQVRTLLPGEPRCQVVITSRVMLTGLIAREGAQRVVLDLLPDADAATLLRRLVGARRYEAEAADAAELLALCGGLPLTIRIAAAHLLDHPETTIAAYVAALRAEGRVALLRVEEDEHHALAAVLGRSVAALPPVARDAFMALATIPGQDFTADAVGAVLDVKVDEALATLVAAHLVQELPGGRFTTHDLVREYAASLVPEFDEAGFSRLMGHYQRLAAAAYDLLRPGYRTTSTGTAAPTFAGVTEARAWFEAERANLAAALDTAAERNLPAYIGAIIGPLWHICWVTGGIASWLGVVERIAATLERHGEDGDVRVEVLNVLGNAYRVTCDYERAVAAHTECAQAWTRAGRTADAARARTNLAMSLDQLGRTDEALTHLESARAAFHDLGLRVFESYVHTVAITDVRRRMGDVDGALVSMRTGLDLMDEQDSDDSRSRALDGLAELWLLKGRPEEALVYARQARDLAARGQNRYLETMAAVTYGAALRAAGELDESLAVLIEACAAFDEQGVHTAMSSAHLELALTHAAMGRADLALAANEAALDRARQSGDQRLQARALVAIGRDLRHALALFEEVNAPEAGPLRRELEESGR